MPTSNASVPSLSRQQIGVIGEHVAINRFIEAGFEVYTPVVDEHGIDLIVRASGDGDFREVQVKTATGDNYAYVPKKNLNSPTSEHRLICLVRLTEDEETEVYLIPVSAWEQPNEALVNRSYDKPGQVSDPELGINSSKKNRELLDQYRFETILDSLDQGNRTSGLAT